MSPSCSGRRVGDAVADHLVHRGAHALRVAVVVERRRVAVALDVQLVHVGVDLVGGDARAHPLAGEAEDLGGEPCRRRACGRSSSGDLTRGSSQRADVAGVGVRRPGDVRRHRCASADDPPGSTRPSVRLWQRLYLRPLPHQHGSLAWGSTAGGCVRSLDDVVEHHCPGYEPQPSRATASRLAWRPMPLRQRRWRTSSPEPTDEEAAAIVAAVERAVAPRRRAGRGRRGARRRGSSAVGGGASRSRCAAPARGPERHRARSCRRRADHRRHRPRRRSTPAATARPIVETLDGLAAGHRYTSTSASPSRPCPARPARCAAASPRSTTSTSARSRPGASASQRPRSDPAASPPGATPYPEMMNRGRGRRDAASADAAARSPPWS